MYVFHYGNEFPVRLWPGHPNGGCVHLPRQIRHVTSSLEVIRNSVSSTGRKNAPWCRLAHRWYNRRTQRNRASRAGALISNSPRKHHRHSIVDNLQAGIRRIVGTDIRPITSHPIEHQCDSAVRRPMLSIISVHVPYQFFAFFLFVTTSFVDVQCWIYYKQDDPYLQNCWILCETLKALC